MSKAFRVLALNTWQFFEYHDSFGMTILDYALTNSEPINQGSAVLDNIFREAARIQAIAIYSSSYVVARAYKALRNEAPFRAWSAFGLHGGSRIRKLQNYLSFTTDSTPSYWLGEADHDGILPTVGDYIAQVRL
jgi:hypothetical protein